MRKKINLWNPSSGTSTKRSKRSFSNSPTKKVSSGEIKSPYAPPHSSSTPVSKVTPSQETAPKQSAGAPKTFFDRPVLRRTQTRRNTVSISVSIEEGEMLKQMAYKEGLSFSAWARKVLFKATGKKIPYRP